MGDRQGERDRTRQQAQSSNGRARGEAEDGRQEQPLGKYASQVGIWMATNPDHHTVREWKSGMSLQYPDPISPP